jgi:hypothetical protein
MHNGLKELYAEHGEICLEFQLLGSQRQENCEFEASPRNVNEKLAEKQQLKEG